MLIFHTSRIFVPNSLSIDIATFIFLVKHLTKKQAGFKKKNQNKQTKLKYQYPVLHAYFFVQGYISGKGWTLFYRYDTLLISYYSTIARVWKTNTFTPPLFFFFYINQSYISLYFWNTNKEQLYVGLG